MKSKNFTIRYSLYMFAGIVAFFALMKLFNMEEVIELRAFNFIIIAIFANRLIQRNLIENSKISYVENLKSAFASSALAVVLSAMGMLFYIALVDPVFVTAFENGMLWGNNLDLSKIIISLFMEGMASSVIVSFTLMQYWKNERRETKEILL